MMTCCTSLPVNNNVKNNNNNTLQYNVCFPLTTSSEVTNQFNPFCRQNTQRSYYLFIKYLRENRSYPIPYTYGLSVV